MTARIAIVGGGFCGTLAAVHLMRMEWDGGLELSLVERAGAPGRGLAYAPATERLLLNVPAGAMSALPGDDHHFLRYARERGVDAEPGDFLPRRLYGDYLEAVLRSAVEAKPGSVRFSVLRAEAVDACPAADGGARVALRDGRTLHADAVILATGHASPADPFPVGAFRDEAGAPAGDDPRYVRDPWAPGALDAVDRRRPVLLVGTGLTLCDVALELAVGGHDAPLHAVSRHGLLPRPHAAAAGAPAPWLLPDGPPAVRRLLRHLRRRLAASPPADWRALLAALRPKTPALWAALPPEQRARFLRHLLPFWEVHRHRTAPRVHAAVEALAAAGRLRPRAGRIAAVTSHADALEVTLRPRGGGTEVLRVGSLVNCTGPDTDVAAVGGAPLLSSLVRQGIATPDEHRLGLRTAPDYALVGRGGTRSRAFFYLGPLLRADHWESTAVPELRVHAARLAAHLYALRGRTPARAA